jgi:hypothetical protein
VLLRIAAVCSAPPRSRGRSAAGEEETTVYTLVRDWPVREMLKQQAPSLGVAFAIASVFYRFHSFALECVAFLATWYVLDAALAAVRRLPRRRSAPESPP